MMRECGISVGRERCKFWNTLLEKSDQKTNLFHSVKVVSKPNGVHAGIGKAGIRLGYVGTDHETWVELNINVKSNAEETEMIYKDMLAESGKIDMQYPELKIRWKPIEKDTEKSRIILSYSDQGGIGDRSKWNDIQDDLVSRMVKFEKIFKTLIHKY